MSGERPTQEQKAEAFRALHEGEPFVIPNPWDGGSARAFEAMGFKALATTSGGHAFTLGRMDGKVTLDEVAEHVQLLSSASDLPISVDLENGYGSDAEAAVAAITRAAEAGAVGGSIEDWIRTKSGSMTSSTARSASRPPPRRPPGSISRSR